MSGAPHPVEQDGTIETLKEIRAVEDEQKAKLDQLKAANEKELAGLRESAEAAVQAARQDAERVGEEALVKSRDVADAEAKQIVDAGEASAAQLRARPPNQVGEHKDEVLAAVLGEFGESKNPD